jgi:hypothetical protein
VIIQTWEERGTDWEVAYPVNPVNRLDTTRQRALNEGMGEPSCKDLACYVRISTPVIPEADPERMKGG